LNTAKTTFPGFTSLLADYSFTDNSGTWDALVTFPGFGTNHTTAAYGDHTHTNMALTTNKLSVFAATTSAELAGVISNETGSGLIVFNNAAVLISPTITTSLNPTTTNGAALGSTAKMWSDLFIASGGVVNFNNGDVTLTHSSNQLAINGGDFNIQGGYTLKYGGNPYFLPNGTAGTDKATWDGDAIYGVTRDAVSAYVAANGGDSMDYPGAGIALSNGSAWLTSITNNSANWNTAYGWGDHAAAGYAPTASPTFTGTVVLPTATSIGSVSSTEIGYVNGVSSAIQTQLGAKAPTASPTLTGTPLAPTAAAATDNTQIATTAFVHDVVSTTTSEIQTTTYTLTASELTSLYTTAVAILDYPGTGKVYDVISVVAENEIVTSTFTGQNLYITTSSSTTVYGYNTLYLGNGYLNNSAKYDAKLTEDDSAFTRLYTAYRIFAVRSGTGAESCSSGSVTLHITYRIITL